MNIVFAASEVAPFAKTGGLADVMAALPRAVARLGHECAIIMPLYRSTRRSADPDPTAVQFSVPIGSQKVPGRIWRSELPRSNVRVFFVEQSSYFERDDPAQGMGLYQLHLPTGRMRDYPDNCARFAFFSRAILEVLPLLGRQPDVLHLNDWQTGLVPVYLRETYAKQKHYAGVKAVFTIHNLAYQGIFWHWDMTIAGLDWSLFNWRQLEFYNHLNLLKAGIVFADAVNTVSPNYAQEIQTREHGCGLDSVLRYYKDKLVGIVNGVDYSEWNPATDAHLPVRYAIEDAAGGKAVNKEALQRFLKLPVRRDVPLVAMISRLAEQKGLKLLHDAAPDLFAEDIQFVVLGVGDPAHHRFLETLKSEYPQKVATVFEFNESLAHRIEAAADMFLMPSRYEPSGLNQLYSLKYGTVPIVRDTGGLHDTVTDYTSATADSATGFMFKEYSAAAFLTAVRRALQVFHRQPDVWRAIQRNGMSQDWSWEHSAKEYVKLYERVLSLRSLSPKGADLIA